MADEAVLDAPLEAGLDTGDTGADLGDSPDGAESPDADAPQPDGDQPPGDVGPVIQGGKLSAAAKATLEEIRAKDPRLAKELKTALFQAESFRREVPGGVRELREMRQHIEALGGSEGIQRTQQELQYWNDLDQQFTAGDPRMIEAMTDTPEGQQAFIKLAPQIFNKYSELDQDGFASYVAKVFEADANAAGIPLLLERLGDFIGENPRAQEYLQKLGQYFGRLHTLANKPVTPKTAAPSGNDRDRELTEREQNLTRTEWRGEAISERMKVFNAEWSRLTAGRKLSDVQQAAVKELYASRLKRSVDGIPGFNDTLQRYFANNDRNGFTRYLNSVHTKEIPKALRAAMDAIVPSKPGPKPAPAGAPQKQRPPAAIDKGYQWSANLPDKTKVDYTKTTGTMIRAGKAILIGGARVQWKR